ncbi:AraC family transcriptional regulator [Marinomonas mediterranea]|jgi:AraC-type DNA-binding domain-containing proteins|uniref:Transcriptional regulator, AraC family n=1 Tax=Marinomonas mediterranea (strain ATCC 700492 / JCM 21426 / NBRC 103028 / MMB-1) TaxID=717774 RepID=F2JXN3_MARM1|nr:helix-turn-helix transcriptional regulator [Marinomonas mediterranea]ADZ93031.1 transcriptional regulator, AraC family [Marinomonas mediterranea MMB-1]WCN19046.1 helix-turn-helix domain-containing protein [Marinomonas mediterranea MMB-1]
MKKTGSTNSNNLVPNVDFRPPSKQGYHFEIRNLETVVSVITDPSTRNRKPLSPNPIEPHRITFHLLLFLTDGKLCHRLDDQKVTLVPNQAIMIHPDQVHAFTYDSQSPKGYMLFLSKEVWPELAETKPVHWSALYHPTHKIEPKDSVSILALFELLDKELKSGKQTRRFPYLTLSALLNLLFERWPTTACIQSERSVKHYLAFRTLLEQEYANTRDANVYADKLGVSYKTLNELCKTFTKQTAKSVIDEFVILEAKRQLLTSDSSLFNIALSLGFQENSNFNKFFRRHIGITPQEYRKLDRQKVRD